MYRVYGSGASHYREGATMELSRAVGVGQVGTLNLEAVQERAARSSCPETAMRLALAKVGIKFRVAEVQNGVNCAPTLLLEILRPVPREQKRMLREVNPPKRIWAGEILFKPEP